MAIAIDEHIIDWSETGRKHIYYRIAALIKIETGLNVIKIIEKADDKTLEASLIFEFEKNGITEKFEYEGKITRDTAPHDFRTKAYKALVAKEKLHGRT